MEILLTVINKLSIIPFPEIIIPIVILTIVFIAGIILRNFNIKYVPKIKPVTDEEKLNEDKKKYAFKKAKKRIIKVYVWKYVLLVFSSSTIISLSKVIYKSYECYVSNKSNQLASGELLKIIFSVFGIIFLLVLTVNEIGTLNTECNHKIRDEKIEKSKFK